jgi:hypothetical protein
MAWRIARSLEQLRNQVNAQYPNRSKASDGVIGDAAHASSASDHNPNRNSVVCAMDLTHDPANGFDAHALAEWLRTHRHPNLRYVISKGRIAGWWNGWQWEASSGHFAHIHVSVGTLGVGDGQTYDRYDDTSLWDINVGAVAPPPPVGADQLLEPGSRVEFRGEYRVDAIAYVHGLWQVRTTSLCPKGFTWLENGMPVEPLFESTPGADQVLYVGDRYKIPGTFTVISIGQYLDRWMVSLNIGGYLVWVDAEPLTEV